MKKKTKRRNRISLLLYQRSWTSSVLHRNFRDGVLHKQRGTVSEEELAEYISRAIGTGLWIVRKEVWNVFCFCSQYSLYKTCWEIWSRESSTRENCLPQKLVEFKTVNFLPNQQSDTTIFMFFMCGQQS